MFFAERVLIAAASDTLRRKLSAKLLDRHIFTDVVTDGSSTIERFGTSNYAVLLLDLGLSGADSVHTLLAGMPADRRPIVLALTDGHSMLSANDTVQIVLRRPFDTVQIADLVQSCLEARSGERKQPRALVKSPEPAPPRRRSTDV